MDPASQNKKAFVCGHGLYQFKVMVFGLKNAPVTFHHLMECVLRDLCGKICFVYLDDIIIYSPAMHTHFRDLQTILDHLRTAGLTVNMRKSNFFQSRLK